MCVRQYISVSVQGLGRGYFHDEGQINVGVDFNNVITVRDAVANQVTPCLNILRHLIGSWVSSLDTKAIYT